MKNKASASSNQIKLLTTCVAFRRLAIHHRKDLPLHILFYHGNISSTVFKFFLFCLQIMQQMNELSDLTFAQLFVSYIPHADAQFNKTIK